jgi:L-amino acid N-acyltransferase YncA
LVGTEIPNTLLASLLSCDQEPETRHEVIGICYISPYRPERLAYTHAGELSLFIHYEHHGQGIGFALLCTLLAVTRETKIREVLAIKVVDEEGKRGGLALRDYYKRWGFREVGTLEKVGFKFGRW